MCINWYRNIGNGFIDFNLVWKCSQPTGEILVDMDDLVFYEVAMEKRDDGNY